MLVQAAISHLFLCLQSLPPAPPTPQPSLFRSNSDLGVHGEILSPKLLFQTITWMDLSFLLEACGLQQSKSTFGLKYFQKTCSIKLLHLPRSSLQNNIMRLIDSNFCAVWASCNSCTYLQSLPGLDSAWSSSQGVLFNCFSVLPEVWKR